MRGKVWAGEWKKMADVGTWSQKIPYISYLNLGKLLNPSNIVGTQKMFVPTFPQCLFCQACSFVLRLK